MVANVKAKGGREMDNYEISSTIGEGTYGIVVKARHKASGQLVAIKKFKESDEDDDVRQTAMREIRLLRQLRHGNIVRLYDVFRHKGRLYLVFEFVERSLLEDMTEHCHGMPEFDVKLIIWQVLNALNYCHELDIVHRDVKPENILLSKHGIVKLCDFGFARPLARPGGKYTEYVATRWYRAPELLVGDANYGKSVDVWAIGCLFAEMILGSPLFPGESDLDQLSKIVQCLGTLPNRYADLFSRNPLYIGAVLPACLRRYSLDERFANFVIDSNALDFLKQCLIYEPNQRQSCATLLRHPFFEGVTSLMQLHNSSLSLDDNSVVPSLSKKRPVRKKKGIFDEVEAEKMCKALKESMTTLNNGGSSCVMMTSTIDDAAAAAAGDIDGDDATAIVDDTSKQHLLLSLDNNSSNNMHQQSLPKVRPVSPRPSRKVIQQIVHKSQHRTPVRLPTFKQQHQQQNNGNGQMFNYNHKLLGLSVNNSNRSGSQNASSSLNTYGHHQPTLFGSKSRLALNKAAAIAASSTSTATCDDRNNELSTRQQHHHQMLLQLPQTKNSHHYYYHHHQYNAQPIYRGLGGNMRTNRHTHTQQQHRFTRLNSLRTGAL